MCGIGLTLLPDTKYNCSDCCSSSPTYISTEQQKEQQSELDTTINNTNNKSSTSTSSLSSNNNDCSLEKEEMLLFKKLSNILHERGPDSINSYEQDNIDINDVRCCDDNDSTNTISNELLVDDDNNKDGDNSNNNNHIDNDPLKEKKEILKMYKDITASANNNNKIKMNQIGSVLHLRGDKITKQPLIHESNNKFYSFCWNGECYDYYNKDKELYDLWNDNTINDTSKILELIINNCNSNNNDDDGDDDDYLHTNITNVFNNIYGEYAFILYYTNKNTNNKKIYFGRDPLGRRSLLISNTKDGLILSSTSIPTTTSSSNNNISIEFDEVIAGRIYCLDISSGILSYKEILSLNCRNRIDNQLVRLWNNDEYLIDKYLYHDIIFPNVSQDMIKASNDLFLVLNNAVRKRVMNVPIPPSVNNECKAPAPVAILFSGGLDSVILSLLAHINIPIEYPIDLLNISFRKDASPDRLASYISLRELQYLFPDRLWRLIEINKSYDIDVIKDENKIFNLIHPLKTVMDFNISCAFYFASYGDGVINIAPSTTSTTKEQQSQKEQEIIIKPKRKEMNKVICSMNHCNKISHDGCLFQACKLCCKCYQRPINKFLGAAALLCPIHNTYTNNKDITKIKKKNRSNNNKQKQQKSSSSSNNNEQHQQHGLIRQYHAKNSIKVTNNTHSSPTYQQEKKYKQMTSKSKVLLSGLGADEFMGGYGRHRTAYKNGGATQLKTTLQMEQKRLWKRNLGRDDRCISSNGKEVRYPFLDIDVVQYLCNKVNVENICNLELEEGYGDKMILRIVGQRLGLKECSCLIKRAIQFGCRIAKESNLKQFGSSRKATGTALYELRSNGDVSDK